MAIRYFDLNGTSAGFGTLTGAWNTTLAYWSTSSAGTATPAAFTFTAEDTAQFGATGTTGTPGTATISTGITVTLNKIVCQNLPANTMTVAHAGTGKLSLAKNAALDVPTFQCDSTLNLNAATDGSDGFLKSGSGSLVLATTTKGVSGAVTVTAGYIVYGVFLVGSNNWLPNVTSYALNNTDAGGLFFQALDAYTLSVPFTGPAARSNDAGIYSYSANGITLSDTASVAAFKGFLAVYAGNTTNYQGQFVLSAFPTELNMFRFNTATTSTTARTNAITINGTGGTCAAAVELYATAAGTGTVHALVDNSTSASTFSGGAFLNASSNASATQTLRLSGSNTAGSAFTGVIEQAASRGVIALDKAGTGKWALSGANTYTGTTTIQAGTLSAQNASALGRDSSLSGGAISVTGGTLELAGGITLDKSGLNISTVTTASPTNAFQVPASGGDNTLEVGSITLNSTILVDVGANAALRFANTGAITGSTFGITKNGTGELDMNATANQFTGAVTFNAGTLTVAATCAPSTNGPLGNSTSTVTVPGTGTLKFDGASNSTISRAVQLTGSTPALEASGSGHIHFSNVSQASGSRTLTLKGTSTANNHYQAALGDASGGTTSVTKDGSGYWAIVGVASYTGLTTVNAGTLDYGGQEVLLTGGVSMTGGVLTNGAGDNIFEADVTFNGGGRVEALLDGAVEVDAVSGTGRLYPVTSSGGNTYTVGTYVQTGATLELVTDANPASAGYGKVTGASDVTVLGTLATGRGVNQRGQCRYGGNLTFASGSVLAIGAAA